MCGRYFVDSDMYKALLEIADDIVLPHDQSLKDLHPGEMVPVLLMEDSHMILQSLKWGFTLEYRKGLVINARAETLLQKALFKDDFQWHRCVIPARGFYEWDALKTPFTFELPGSPCLFMAGLYNEAGQMAIITTCANASMQAIHPRMPLLLPISKVKTYLTNRESAKHLIQRIPEDVIVTSGLQQQSFF